MSMRSRWLRSSIPNRVRRIHSSHKITSRSDVQLTRSITKSHLMLGSSGRYIVANETTRRDMLKTTLAIAGWNVLAGPRWILPALAQGETLVPFTDIPANANFAPAVDRRTLDIRTIDGPFTPK